MSSATERRDYLRAQRAVLASDEFLPGEKAWLEYYWDRASLGSFKYHLWEAIVRADDHNISKLVMAYPDEVLAYLEWHRGTLKQRVDDFFNREYMNQAREGQNV